MEIICTQAAGEGSRESHASDDQKAQQRYGHLTPNWLDRVIIAATTQLPDNWLGLRLAIGMRRIVTMRIPGDEGIDVNRWGLRMRLHPRRNGCEKGLLFTPQMYEAQERAALSREISKAEAAGRPFVFVDAGANVGLFSLFVASRAGVNAKILAIEPEPENLRRMHFNIEANPGLPIRPIPVALGAQEGRVALEVHPRDRGGTRVRSSEGHDAHAQFVEVECRTLLAVLQTEGIDRLDALKIDVEGAEVDILEPFFRDAPRRLWPRFLIIEDGRAGWRLDLFSKLEALGYQSSGRSRLNVMMALRTDLAIQHEGARSDEDSSASVPLPFPL